jgi:CubicO group peptidase (beta-lactamase class C family)
MEVTMPPAKCSPGESVAGLLRRSRTVLGVAVIEQSGIAWTRSAGGPADRLFQAGSISKPVTAAAALELAARGRADLDGDVNQQLTSWRLPGSPQVSLRQLLGHTAGTGVPFFPGYRHGAEVPTLGQVLDGVPPSATPAVRADPARHGRFCYSGGGYAVIQQLITDITGLPFADAARSLVLEPLGMTRSTFDQPLPVYLRPAAARQDWHSYPEAAVAGLWTTPGDLARYACALQAALAGRPSPIRPQVAAQLLTPHARLPAKGQWNLLPLMGMRPPDSCGLGMFLHGDDRFSHIGGAASFFSVLTASTTDGTGAVVMTAANPAPFPFRLLRAISDEHGWNGYRQPARKRLHGLPGIRNLTKPATGRGGTLAGGRLRRRLRSPDGHDVDPVDVVRLVLQARLDAAEHRLVYLVTEAERSAAAQPSLPSPACRSSPFITGVICTSAFSPWKNGSAKGTRSDECGRSNTMNAVRCPSKLTKYMASGFQRSAAR